MRAKYSFAEDELFYEKGIPSTCCFKDLALVIVPNGDVFPCCCESELSKSLSLGNVHKMSLKEIVDSAKANYMVRMLTQAGPASFIPIIEKAGLFDKTNRRYTNMCHLCNTIFENDDFVKVIKGHIEEGENKVYEDLISTIAEKS